MPHTHTSLYIVHVLYLFLFFSPSLCHSTSVHSSLSFFFFVSSPLLSPLLSQATEPELLGPALHQKVSKLYQRHRYGRCNDNHTHTHTVTCVLYIMLRVIRLHNYSNVIIVAFLEQCQLQRLNWCTSNWLNNYQNMVMNPYRKLWVLMVLALS